MARRNKKIKRASPADDVVGCRDSTTDNQGSDTSTSSSCTSISSNGGGIDAADAVAVYNRSDSLVSEAIRQVVVANNDDECQSQYTTNKHTARQSLLWICLIFSVGVLTGVVYVGWVQHQYGFGVDPVLEQRYLPYGPTTTERSCVADKVSVAQTTVPTATKLSTSRSIHLNRENPRYQKPLVSTLFGIEYSSVVATRQTADSSDSDATTRTRKALPGSTQQHSEKASASPSRQIQVSNDWNRLATTSAVSITSTQANMLRKTAKRAHESLPNLYHRTQQVSWGGPHNKDIPETNWWYRVVETSTSSESLDTIDGGHLLYAYLHIMKWNPSPHFPFRLCGEKGCPPERAIAHSLEWREKYQPWLVPPSLLEENANGYVYHRGFSPGGDTQKHATVWLRVGHHVKNDLAFFRGILNSVDRSIADGLAQSGGVTGKFNVIIDCAGFSLANTPTVAALKQTITMLQDHFPNRLGMIFLVNFSRFAQGFLNLVLRLITKEVRDKIKVLPNRDPAKRMAILKTVLEEQWIPDWLGGTDTYQFDVDEYYPSHLRCTEEEAQEFLSTMPYHAK